MVEGIQVEQCSNDSQYLVTYRNEGRLVAARFATPDTLAQATSDLCAIMATRHQSLRLLMAKFASNTSPR